MKLTDFGFACFYAPEHGLRQVLGSPLYMAPEIVQAQSYGKSVDIWAVGCIAHILLTGAPPFFGESKNQIYRAIVNAEPTFGKVRASLSPDAVDFVLNCLSKNPSERLSSQ